MSDDLWIEWSGGDCPVEPEQSVQLRLRDGRQVHGAAKYFQWTHDGAGFGADIVAYYVQ